MSEKQDTKQTSKPYNDQPLLDLTKSYWELETTLQFIRAQELSLMLSYWHALFEYYGSLTYIKYGEPIKIKQIDPIIENNTTTLAE